MGKGRQGRRKQGKEWSVGKHLTGEERERGEAVLCSTAFVDVYGVHTPTRAYFKPPT